MGSEPMCSDAAEARDARLGAHARDGALLHAHVRRDLVVREHAAQHRAGFWIITHTYITRSVSYLKVYY